MNSPGNGQMIGDEEEEEDDEIVVERIMEEVGGGAGQEENGGYYFETENELVPGASRAGADNERGPEVANNSME